MLTTKKRLSAAALAGAAALAMGSLTPAYAGDFPLPQPKLPGVEKPNFKPATIDPVQNSTVGVGQPIIITFDKAPANRARIEKFVQVEVFNSKKERYDVPSGLLTLR